MHFSRLQDSQRATRVCFLSLRGRRRSQSLQDQPVMVGNPAGVGVCGIGKKKETKKEKGKKKTVRRRPLKHQKDNLRLKILWCLRLLVGLKGRDSLLLSAACVGEV